MMGLQFRCSTLESMLGIVDDANTTVVDDGLTAYGIADFKRKLEAWKFGFMHTSREIERRQHLIDVVVISVHDKYDALDVAAVLFQKPTDSP